MSNKEIPSAPNKEQVVKLLNKTHMKRVQNWTMKDQQEAFEALRTLSFLWYRDESILDT